MGNTPNQFLWKDCPPCRCSLGHLHVLIFFLLYYFNYHYTYWCTIKIIYIPSIFDINFLSREEAGTFHPLHDLATFRFLFCKSSTVHDSSVPNIMGTLHLVSVVAFNSLLISYQITTGDQFKL